MRRLLVGPLLAVLFVGGGQAQEPVRSSDTPAASQADAKAAQPVRPPSSAEDQEPSAAVFRTEINYVEVDATVTDDEGDFVEGLTRDDFEIFEDGVRQEIATFTEVSIPIEQTETTLFDGEPVPRDIATNEEGVGGRVFVIVLDDVHTHALRSALVKQAANEFIEKHMGANDIAAVVYTGGAADAAQEFTSNKLLLERSVNRFIGRKIRSATLERLDAYNRQVGTTPPESGGDSSLRPGRGIRDPLDFERAYYARTAMDALRNVARYLDDVHGRRKAILFFSEGIDYDMLDVMGDIQRNASTVLYSVKDAIAAATRNNVAFYTIDPRGLVGMLGQETIEMTAPPQDPAYGISEQSLSAEVRRSQDSLRTLAEETGGIAIVNTNDFATGYDRIVRANSQYYLLGYYSTNERRDGRYRRIEVRVDRPDVTVVARKGYVAPRGRDDDENERRDTSAAGGTSPEVQELLDSPLPQPGLTLGVTAAPFKGTDDKAAVAVTIRIPGQALPFRNEDDRAVNEIEVSLVALDQDAKVQGGDRILVEPKLRPQTYRLVQLTGFRLVQKLELPPGRYQLRVAAREAEKGLRGSVFYDLQVPDYDDEKLAMSGVLLTSRAAALTLTPSHDEEIKQMLEEPPTVTRIFVPGDVLTAYAEVYDALRPGHKLAITTRVASIDRREIFRAIDERASSELQGEGGGFGHKVDIPLAADVKPGKYVLEIEATPTIGEERVSRALSFEVVEPPAPPPTTSDAVDTPPPSGAVAFANFAFGPLSDRQEPEQLVIRSEAEWKALWQSLPTQQALPTVDFEQEMLVGVFLGERATGGYAVRILGVERGGNGLVVKYREIAPGPDAEVSQQVTSPFVVARVVRSDGPVRFERFEAPKASQ